MMPHICHDQKTAEGDFGRITTTNKEANMVRKLMFLVAVIAATLFLVPASASAAANERPIANAASSGSVLPIYKTKLTSTAKLRSAMKARPEIAREWVAKTGGGKVDRGEWYLCGTVTKKDRRMLERRGYKNTGYTLDGRKVRLSKLKPGAMRWVCRVDTAAVERDLKKKVGPKAKCKRKVYKSGTVTVICSYKSKTLKVKPPKKAKRLAVGYDCTNAQEKGDGQVDAGDTLRGYWTAWETEWVKKGETIVCPGGASATAIAEAYAKGFGYGRTRKAAVKMAKANAKAKVKVSGSCEVPVEVKPIPVPIPPQPQPPVQPPVMAYAKAVATASASATAECPDGTIATATGSGYGEGESWSTVSYEDAWSQAYAIAKAMADANAAANAVATVKCADKPPPPPDKPEPKNTPPEVELLNGPEHMYELGGTYRLCATISDAETPSNRLQVEFKSSSTAVTTSAPFFPEPTTQPNKVCSTLTGVYTQAGVTVTVTVSDGKASASDTTDPFPVVADEF